MLDDPPTVRFPQLAGQRVLIAETLVDLEGRRPKRLRTLNFSERLFNQRGVLNLVQYRRDLRRKLDGHPDRIQVDNALVVLVRSAVLQPTQMNVFTLMEKPCLLSLRPSTPTTGVESPIDLDDDFCEGEPFDATSLEDARQKMERAVFCRPGQREFRNALLRAYSGRCAISGCHIAAVLDAAHIVPYRGRHMDHLTNGLLLRTDLHKLFDNRLISIDPKSSALAVHPSLRGSEYAALHGAALAAPRRAADRPSKEALAMHWQAFLLIQDSDFRNE